MNYGLTSVSLAVLVLLSGCTLFETIGRNVGNAATPSGTPTVTPAPLPETPTPTPTDTDTSTPVPTLELRTLHVDVRSQNETPFTLTLMLVDDPVEDISVRYADGSERSFVLVGGRLPEGALTDAVDLSPTVPVERRISHQDPTPTDGVGIRIPTAASDVLYVVTVDGLVVGWDYRTCGEGDVLQLDLTVRDDGLTTNQLGCGF